MKKTIFLSFISFVCFIFSCIYGSEAPAENDERASGSKFLQMRITNDEDCDKFKITRTYLGPDNVTTQVIFRHPPCKALTIKLVKTIIRMDEVALREIERHRESGGILSSDSDSDDSDSDDTASDGMLSPCKEKKGWFKWFFNIN
ncbi:MAG: hypothetical protein NT128_05770 [Proteobacteria bacterium]|nr:hypothetical protein [Pseudomonadota bacterium]